MLGGRRRTGELTAELARTHALLIELGALDDAARESRRREAEEHLARVLREEQEARNRLRHLQGSLAEVQADLVSSEAEQLLQTSGVYSYAHPLADAVAYKEELARLKVQIKAKVTGRDAVTAAQGWTVNGSSTQGAKMVKDFSTLMLRAYNAEADNCVRTVKPYTLGNTLTRLEKTTSTIARLGKTMSIAVAPDFHRLRVREIELTADHLAKVEAEREVVRAQREAAREEEAARRDFEREKARLLKERAHYANTYDRLVAQGKQEQAQQLLTQLEGIEEAITGVEERAANSRAGYVYVISNVGSFGPEVVKVGMTRRLEPMDRVRELGDASVPFRFDVHALVFSDDAVGLESSLHRELAEQRVNRVNLHREFFRTEPAHVRDLLERMAGNHLLEFTETAEALEWRASGAHTTLAPPPPERITSPLASEDADDVEEATVTSGAAVQELTAGDVVPLSGRPRVRMAISSANGCVEDIDPVALLLTREGVVRSDADVVFFSQPDHDSGSVVLAADDEGALQALHVDTAKLPTDVSEVLFIAQVATSGEHPSGSCALGVSDLATGAPLGRASLPAAGSDRLVQIGALQRRDCEWVLVVQPEALEMTLEALVTAAGVTVDA